MFGHVSKSIGRALPGGGGRPSLVSAAGALVEQVVDTPAAIQKLIDDDAEYNLVHDDPLLWPYVLANDEAALALLEGGRGTPFSGIEIMTSNVGVEGEAIRSSIFGAQYEPWHVFDGVGASTFFAANTKVNEYCGYVFNQKVEFETLSYTPQSNYPVNSRWEITQDGSIWATAHSFTGGTSPHTHTLAAPTIAKGFRLFWTSGGGGSAWSGMSVMNATGKKIQ